VTLDGARALPLGFEPFGTAVGLAVIAGALALRVPELESLAGALGALGIAAWASGLPAGAWRRSDPKRGRRGLALAVAALAALAYLRPDAAIASGRALLLAVGLVPLWLVERRRSAGRLR
jgi:hypothetical protein